MSVTKKKRVSKKNKISWRKHVDIADVENFLEDKRLEERLGKPVAEKSNEELFVLDTNPTAKPGQSSKQKRRMLLRDQAPKCFSMLQPHTAVPDPVIKRNRVRTKEERKNKLIKKKDDERRSKGLLKAKELQALQDRKLHEMKMANKPETLEFNVDIWDPKVLNKEGASNEWISNDAKKNTLRGTGKFTKAIPKSVQKKKSAVAAIEPPHPGTSYNPSYTDHQALLQKVVEKEEGIIKKEKHLARVTGGMFKKVTSSERDKNWIVEMSEGLEKGPEEEEEQTEYKSVNPPVKNKKKNLKQRRKQKEQQQLEQARQKAHIEKQKNVDIQKIKFVQKHIGVIVKRAAMLREQYRKKMEAKKDEPHRLGPIKFEEPELDFTEPNELTSRLINMKTKGSVLWDRLKSMQKRNMMQPAKLQSRARAKYKRFKRPGHKDDWKAGVAKAKTSS